MLTPADLKQARMLVQRQFATEEQVARCLNELKELPAAKPLLDLMAERGIFPAARLAEIRASLAHQERREEDQALGQRVVARGLASDLQIAECFAIIEDLEKKGAATIPRLGQLLLSKGYVTEEEINLLVQSGDTGVIAAPAPVPSPAAAVAPAPKATATPQAMPAPGTPAQKAKPTPKAMPAPGAPAPKAKPTPKAMPAPGAAGGAIGLAPARHAGGPMVRCMFCGMEIREGIPRQTCGFCGDLYHAECWAKAQGCVKDDCRRMMDIANKPQRVLGTSHEGLIDQLKPIAIKVGALAAAVALVVYLYMQFAHDAEYYYNCGKSLGRKDTSQDAGRAWRAIDLHRGLMAAEGAQSNIEKTVNIEEQIKFYQLALGKKPDFVDCLYDLGQAYLEIKRDKDAYECFDKVLKLKPDHLEAMLTLGATAQRLADNAAAEKWYKRAIETKADFLPARLALAVLYDDQLNQKDLAAIEYQKVFDAKPDDSEIAKRLANILILQKKFDAALVLLDRAEKQDPNSPGLKASRAQLLFDKSETARAAQDQVEEKKLLEMALPFAEAVGASDKADATQVLAASRIQALALYRLGRNAEAYVVAKKIAGSLNDPELLRVAGQLAIDNGEADTGISYLRLAFNLNKKPELLDQIGDILLSLDRPDQARAEYESLRSLKSSYPRVNFKVGLAAAADRDKMKAVSAVKELVGRFPSDVDLQALEARLMREAGDVTGCLTKLDAILATGAKSSFVLIQRGITLRGMGRQREALGAFRAALELGDAEGLYELGMTYDALQNEAEARKKLDEYVHKVSFGANYTKARAFLERQGGPAPVANEFSWPLQLVRDSVPKFATGAFVDPQQWDYVTTAVYGLNGIVGILAGNLQQAQTGASTFQSQLTALGYNNLQVAGLDPENRDQVREADLSRNVDLWVTTLTSCATSLAELIKKKDAKSGDAVDKLLDDLRQASGGTGPERATAAARAFTSLLGQLVVIVSDNDTTHDQINRINSERQFQVEFAANALQSLCGEFYAAVKVARLLVSVQDRRKVYEEPLLNIIRRFDKRESDAKNVLDQLRSSSTSLVELLYIVASDPALKP